MVAREPTKTSRAAKEVINEIPEIDSTQSTVILSSFKDSRVMPIPEVEAEDEANEPDPESRKGRKSSVKTKS